MGPLKTCTKCRRSLLRDNFSKQRAKPDGLRSNCKSCIAIQALTYRARRCVEIAAYRAAHLEQTKAYNAFYRAANNATLNACKRVWYTKNKAHILEIRKILYRNDPFKHNEKVKCWQRNNADLVLGYKSKNRKASCENLNDSYVKRLLVRKGSAVDIPSQLIEAKREHLRFVRLIEE